MNKKNSKKDNYSVLAVCSANKGRSASFHAHLKHLLKSKEIDYITVDSAGLNEQRINKFYEKGDVGANPWIKEILVKEGVPEILEHKIKPVDESLIDQAYVVLTFETHIRDELRSKYSQHSDKIHTLREYTCINIPENSFDVDDAYNPKSGLYRGRIPGRTMKAFVKVSNESKRLARKTLDKLMEEIQTSQK